MTDRGFFVVVTGLPGAGKSTLALSLADELGIPLVSKDAIKEALFVALGTGDWAWSKTLSRAADAALVEIARDLDSAVLDNYWHADTVVALLAPLAAPLVEVACLVAPEVAWRRFRTRVRHPGHADHGLEAEDPPASFRTRVFPLGSIGPIVEVDASAPVDAAATALAVVAAIGRSETL